MFQVGIVGPEASGKTSLARYLSQRYNGVLIPEYGREYMEQRGGTAYTAHDVETIAEQQIATMEKMRKEQPELVFYDTELIITKIWFEVKYAYCPIRLRESIRRYKMDVYLLCYPDIKWEWDMTRENGEDAKRIYLFNLYEKEIQATNTPYYIIRHRDS